MVPKNDNPMNFKKFWPKEVKIGQFTPSGILFNSYLCGFVLLKMILTMGQPSAVNMEKESEFFMAREVKTEAFNHICVSRSAQRAAVVYFIKMAESYSKDSYLDGPNREVNRYGTLVKYAGESISEVEATYRLNRHLDRLVCEQPLSTVDHWTRMVLLSSLYNLNRFGKDLSEAVRTNDAAGIQRNLNRYINANGNPLKGLIKRRSREVDLLRLGPERGITYIAQIKDFYED